MNAARLTRKWTDAGGDPTLMAEALADEINDPAAGLVSRDHLDTRIAELQGRMDRRFAELQGQIDHRLAELQGQMDRRFGELQGQMDQRFAELQGQMDRRFAESQAWLERRLGEHAMATTWRMLGMLGGQLVLIGALIKLLNPS
jgi:uncharacterized small protein (DUF1192 family)